MDIQLLLKLMNTLGQMRHHDPLSSSVGRMDLCFWHAAIS